MFNVSLYKKKIKAYCEGPCLSLTMKGQDVGRTLVFAPVEA